MVVFRLESSEHDRKVAVHENASLEQSLAVERERRLALEETLTQVQEQLRLQEYGSMKEVGTQHGPGDRF